MLENNYIAKNISISLFLDVEIKVMPTYRFGGLNTIPEKAFFVIRNSLVLRELSLGLGGLFVRHVTGWK